MQNRHDDVFQDGYIAWSMTGRPIYRLQRRSLYIVKVTAWKWGVIFRPFQGCSSNPVGH
jgi:hypothetical protein